MARRKATVALGVAGALLVIVPGVIIASGLGRILGDTLIALASLFGTAGSLVMRQRTVDRKVRLGALCVIAASVAVGVAGLFLRDRFAPPATANLHIVNNSPSSSIDVFVDGKAVETDVPVSSGEKENASAARWVTVPAGMHTLEAKDPAGKVLDSQTMELSPDHYLFAPAHNPKTCFVLTIDGYGTWLYKSRIIELERALSLWKIPEPVDRWWQKNPSEVQARGYGTIQTAIRQMPCVDPAL